MLIPTFWIRFFTPNKNQLPSYNLFSIHKTEEELDSIGIVDQGGYTSTLQLDSCFSSKTENNSEEASKLFMASDEKNSNLVIGHRGMGKGFVNNVYENTIESFQLAAKNGADMVECDVQLTKDGHLIVFHDSTLNGKDVSEMTHQEVENFKNYSISKGDDRSWNSNPKRIIIPQLDDLFDTLPSELGINIEIKYPNIEISSDNEYQRLINKINDTIMKLINVVKEKGGKRRLVFSSFGFEACLILKQMSPEFVVLLLIKEDAIVKAFDSLFAERRKLVTPTNNLDIDLKCIEASNFFFKNIMNANLDGIVLDTSVIREMEHLCKLIANNSMIIYCYGDGTNDKIEGKYLLDHKVHGVITDSLWFYTNMTQ